MSEPTFPALGLDLATRAGYALRTSEKMILKKGINLTLFSGVIDLSIVTPSQATENRPASHPGLRFNKYREFLIQMIEKHDVKVIYYEKPVGGRNMGGAKAQVAIGLEVVTLEVASVYGLPVTAFHVNTVKKHATGFGGANKDKQPMIDAALERFPGQEWVSHKPTKRAPWTLDDNQADALHVLDCGLVSDSIL